MNEPVYDENLVLDIETGREQVRVELYDVYGQEKKLRGFFYLTLTAFKDQADDNQNRDYKIDQMPLDFLEQVQLQNDVFNDKMGEVHVQVQWIYSKVALLDSLISELTEDLAYNEKTYLPQIQETFQSLSEPFNFFDYKVRKLMRQKGQKTDENTMKALFALEPSRYEEQLAEKIGHYIPGSPARGKDKGSFFWWTFYLTIALLFITVLVCFYKADFVNLTVCCMALYQLEMIKFEPIVLKNAPKPESYKYWRMCVGFALLSVVYDILWLLMKSSEYSEKDAGDAGVEKSIRSFSLFWTYISMFAKLVMSLVYWKTSLNFDKLVEESHSFRL